jgi:hypothetical protein
MSRSKDEKEGKREIVNQKGCGEEYKRENREVK